MTAAVNIGEWIRNLPAWVWITIVAHLLILGGVAYMILLERKVASWTQDRIGPNRVGLGFGIIPGLKNMHMFGLGQPLADGLKFILKEDYRAKGVDKVLFTAAPIMMIIVIIISIAVVPMGGIRQATKTVTIQETESNTNPWPVMAQLPGIQPHQVLSIVPVRNYVKDGKPQQVWDVTYRYPFQITDLNIGVLYVLAVLALAVYGVVIGGWASNNKYSFLGGLRATANMISYEIPLGLAVLCIVLMFGTLNLETIVEQQARYWGGNGSWALSGWFPAWNIVCQPVAFLIFLVCIHAEANRAPFDLAEAEQELVGGYHTEYSSMRFAMFFLAEYAGMVTTSIVCVALFFGGWHLPWLDKLPYFVRHMPDPGNPAVTDSLIVCLIRCLVVAVKTTCVIFFFMWVRWSLPRFRFDQLMMLAWRALIPISLGLMVVTALIMYFWAPALPTKATSVFYIINGQAALVLLGGSVLVVLVSMAVSLILPAPPPTNRKVRIPGSRFARTPLPAGAPAAN